MTTLSETNFQQVQPPKHPTPGEVESYRADANRAGREDSRELLRAGKPALAFYRIARTTEDEANILGLTGTRIPMAPAMQRLARRGWV